MVELSTERVSSPWDEWVKEVTTRPSGWCSQRSGRFRKAHTNDKNANLFEQPPLFVQA